MTLMVDYCPRCGTVYQKNFRKMCNGCSNELDSTIKRCMDHLWRYPNSTTEELSQAADVEITELYQFIKEGKFSFTYPKLTFPCECCRQPIRQGRICSSCTGSFKEAFPVPAATVPAARTSGTRTSHKTLFTSRGSSRR
ncbi:hypothetical protein AR543_15840 [Paenibacillus bovis]|uniref:Flagellar protein n=2 Tax=Paenibacillus bovis TaxID=1616788 RepID=A0A172ZJ73_9BACL|nr:hypothetical protein AR543_15840 [Paenibacillus bovis]